MFFWCYWESTCTETQINLELKLLAYSLRKLTVSSARANLTLALCWLFRKRSFAVSGDFLESLKTGIKKLE